jgi:hypothetical protein
LVSASTPSISHNMALGDNMPTILPLEGGKAFLNPLEP